MPICLEGVAYRCSRHRYLELVAFPCICIYLIGTK
jgi:hypothetical protein